MKRKQYFISTRDGKIEVTGHPVVIPGYEQFNFFAHRPYHTHLCKTGWDISEETTMLRVMPSSWAGGYNNNTHKGALAIVIAHFKSMGYEYTVSAINREIEIAKKK